MHSGEQLAIAAAATAAEVELIRTRMRTTLALVDAAIAHRRRARLSVVDGRSCAGQKVGDDG